MIIFKKFRWFILSKCALHAITLYGLFFYQNSHAAEITIRQGSGMVRSLGTGYDSKAQSFRGACVSGSDSRQTQGSQLNSGSIQLRLETDQSSLAKKLGFEVGGKARLGVIEASASAKFLSESKESALSLSFNYLSEYLSETFLVNDRNYPIQINSGFERYLEDSMLWFKRCGDDYVYSIEEGARLLINMRVDFVSKEEKEAFEAKFSVNGPLFSANGELQTESQSFSKKTKLTISAIQEGGDPSYLGSAFSSGCSHGQAKEQDELRLISCTFGELNHCIQVMAGIAKYGNGQDGNDFPTQIRERRNYALLKLHTQPWIYLGGEFSHPPVAEEVTTSVVNLREMQGLFEENYQNWLESSRYLNAQVPRLSKNRPDGTPGQFSKMKHLAGYFRSNLTEIAAGVRDCYENPSQCGNSLRELRAQLGVGTQVYCTNDDIQKLLKPVTYAQYCDQRHSNGDLGYTIEVLNQIAFKKSGMNQGEWEEGDTCEKAEEVLVTLEELDLSAKQLVDLRPVSALHRLKKLNLSQNVLESADGPEGAKRLPALKSLMQLQELNLNENKLVDVSSLAEMPSLRKIWLQGNRIDEVQSLSALPDLNLLDVRRNLRPFHCSMLNEAFCLSQDYSELTSAAELYSCRFNEGCVGMASCAISDGRIVFSGGMNKERILKAEISILDTRRLQWTDGGRLVERRAGHTATLIDGGNQILFVGGDHLCDHFEIYELTSRTALIGVLEVSRFGHSATKMKDGKVLIAGGFTNGLVPSADRNHSTPTSEIFDLQTQSTVMGSSMNQRRGYHAAILLDDGRVMVSGGLVGSDSLNGIEFYDPKLEIFKRFRNFRMNEGRFFHTMTLLPDGRVLIAGGFGQDGKALASAEIYNPIDSTVTLLVNLNEARGAHTAILLDKRWVLLAGGSERYFGGLSSEDSLNGKSLRSTEVFDARQNRFVMTGFLKVARGFHQSCAALEEESCHVFFTPGMGQGRASTTVEYMDWNDLPQDNAS